MVTDGNKFPKRWGEVDFERQLQQGFFPFNENVWSFLSSSSPGCVFLALPFFKQEQKGDFCFFRDLLSFSTHTPVTRFSSMLIKLNPNQLQGFWFGFNATQICNEAAKNRFSTEFRFFIAVVKLRASISIWIFMETREGIARNKDSNFMGIFYDGNNTNGWCNSERKFTHAILSLLSQLQLFDHLQRLENW